MTSQDFLPWLDEEDVHALTARLSAYGIRAWLFGGWAEELLGLTAPRPHKDLDLLYPADSFDLLDAFVNTEGVQEIPVKRSGCSRALVADRHVVEFYLVCEDAQGWHTDFWGYVHRWPKDTFDDKGEFPKASKASLTGLRSSFANVERAFDNRAQRLRKQRCRIILPG